MPNQNPVETSSLFSLREIRERMKEKKNGTLKTTKMNASIAAKIRTKTINNSSIIKVTLKQNNKALALALSAAKREARELITEKMLLQKEVKLGDFERARLRQKLSAVVDLFVRMHHKHKEYTEELQQFMNNQLHAVVKLSSPSERDACSLSPFDERLSATDMTDDQANDNCPVRTAPKAMRIPVVQKVDDKCENGTSNLASTSQPVIPLQLPTLAMGEPLKNVANPAVGKPSSSCLMDEPLANNESSGQPSGEMDGSALALVSGAIFGGSPSSIPPSPRSCSLSGLNNNNNLGQHSKISRSYGGQMGLSLGHVTERRKRTTGFSALSRNCSLMELFDSGPLVGLMLPKEMEPPEISQMGELVTLKAQNKGSNKIKASEDEALEKMSMGKKGRDSLTGKSKGNLDNCHQGPAPNTTQPKALGINPVSTEVSAQVVHLEKIQPWNSRGQNKGHNSQCFSKTVDPSTIHVVSPYHVHDLSLSEKSSSNVKHTSAAESKNDAKEVPSGRQKTMQETPKESSPKTAPHLNKNKTLNSLTDATQSLCHATLLEEPLIRRCTRARKPVTYEEPKLNRKLRRGDPCANSDLFSCPIYKTRRKKMTKCEAISKESSSDPVP